MKKYIENKNGINIEVKAEEGYGMEVDMLMNILIRLGEELKDEYILEVGWAIFKIKELKHGKYTVRNPNYLGNPKDNYTEDLTLSLRIIDEHRQIINLFGIEGEDTRYDDRIVVTESAVESDDVFMQRLEDTGWYVGSVNEPKDEREKVIRAYELLRLKPELIKTLILPKEYIAIYKEGYLVSVLNEKDEDILEVSDLG